jgi:oxaloacetate decarboxylase alpha subunit
MSDRFDEVLEEVVHVREDLGHPISATPFSQLMGIQAVLNVVTGERYGSVPDEVLEEARRQSEVLETEKQARLVEARADVDRLEPPQPTIGELCEQYGDRTMSDEELLRRYLVPRQDVEATHAAGPAPRPTTSSTTGARVADQRSAGSEPDRLRRDRDGGSSASAAAVGKRACHR